MNRFIATVAAVLLMVFAPQVLAKTTEQKIHTIAWVVFCEDNTDMTAAKLVLSTLYNRAGSYDAGKLYKAAAAPKQYNCYNIKPTKEKLASKRFKDIKSMVKLFITERQRPITRAKYFYNHRLVAKSKLGKMRLAVVKVYGSHTYLV